MASVTLKVLEAAVKTFNNISELEGKVEIEMAYGGYKLVYCTKKIRKELTYGYVPKREVYNFLLGMLNMLELKRNDKH